MSVRGRGRPRPARRGRRAGATLGVLVLCGCGGGPWGGEPRAERFDSAGVAVVRWGAAERAAPWRARIEDTLAGATHPVRIAELRRGDVAVGPGGAVHLLDRRGRRVLVLAPSGGAPDTLGAAAGDGAALEAPTLLAVSPEGRVAVFDRPRRGVLAFDGAGAPELLPVPQPLQGTLLAWTERGLLGVVGRFAGRDTLEFRLVAFSPAGAPLEELASLRRPVPELLAPPGCRAAVPFPLPFQPDLVWDARGPRVAVAAGPEYRIALLGGGQERVVERALAPRPADAAAAAREVGDSVHLADEPACRLAAEEVVAVVGHAPLVPAIGALALGPDGTLWVRRRSVAPEASVTDLYDADGELVGALPAGTPFPAAFLSEDAYLAVEGDALVRVRLERAGR